MEIVAAGAEGVAFKERCSEAFLMVLHEAAAAHHEAGAASLANVALEDGPLKAPASDSQPGGPNGEGNPGQSANVPDFPVEREEVLE